MSTSENNYEILHQIGRGSYASVHMAINRQSGQICAIKKIPITSEISSLVNEISILSNCECKNIVQFLGSECSDQAFLIVMEYCCAGSVKDVMRHLNRTMNEEQITAIVKDVLNGLDYLHQKKKIHRDVKAANILLNKEGIAKIGDFGVSEHQDTSNQKKQISGTLLWLPPEGLDTDPQITPVVDIWSLGITIIEMGDGQPPYSELELRDALDEISNISKPPPSFKNKTAQWSDDLLNFLGLCLNKDKSKRATANELLDQEVIKKASSTTLKRLVIEVCQLKIRGTEGDVLFKKCDALMKQQHADLSSIYNGQKLEVMRVDQFLHFVGNLERDFSELRGKILTRNSIVHDLTKRSDESLRQYASLRQERDSLKILLDEGGNKKVKLLSQLGRDRDFGKRHDEPMKMNFRSPGGKSG